eukprot:c17139_g1_i1 orf=590-2572(-)
MARWLNSFLEGRHLFGCCYNSLFVGLVLVFSLVGLWQTPAAAADLNSDKQALLAFYNGLVFARRVQWNTSASPCSWVGVGCSPSKDRVWSLRLPATGLYGQIAPRSIGLLSELRFLSLRSNGLSGPVPADLADCAQLRAIYLQGNLFSGPLPSFKPSRHFSRINLSFNTFNGSIPASFNGLTRLGTLYLQNNSLTGNIPDLNFLNLAQFSVENNELNGSIPKGLQRFSSSAFSGNRLCGPPYFPPCSVLAPSPSPVLSNTPLPSRKSRKLNTGEVVAIIVATAALLFLIAICFFLLCLKRRSSELEEKVQKAEKGDDSKDEFSSAQEPERKKLVFFEGSPYTFDLEDLLRASAEVLGKGSVGTAYKAVLEDGSTVVVKRLKDVAVGRKEFEQQMELNGRMRHNNLVSLMAYYYSKDEKLLVHDYLPLGSLSALLHGSRGSGRTPLDWDTRVKIALGAARGIAYLHEQGGSRFTHGNIKSCNVLLNRNLEACVSDFGLAPLFSPASVASRIVGYKAPEVAETRRVTQKSDVYSFGVLLLELLTGRAPTQTTAEEGIDLPRWVQSVVREEWTAEVFDVELMQYQNIEEEMVQLLQIAMASVATMPDQRPKMEQLVKMIEDIRQFDTDDNRQSSSEKSRESNGQTPSRGISPEETRTPAPAIS